MNSINVDWSEEVDNSNWDFISHNFLTSGRSCPKCYEPLEEKTKHMMGDETAMSEELVYHCGDCNKDFEEADTEEVDHEVGFPIMNYAYLLNHTSNVSDEKILEISKRTSCCIVYNNNEDKYYLALTGGGMNLSQDIALAYIILEDWIPEHLVSEVCLQPCLSVNKKEMNIILEYMDKAIERSEGMAVRLKEEVKESRKRMFTKLTKKQVDAVKPAF